MGETRVFAAELWLQLSFAVSGHQELRLRTSMRCSIFRARRDRCRRGEKQPAPEGDILSRRAGKVRRGVEAVGPHPLRAPRSGGCWDGPRNGSTRTWGVPISAAHLGYAIACFAAHRQTLRGSLPAAVVPDRSAHSEVEVLVPQGRPPEFLDPSGGVRRRRPVVPAARPPPGRKVRQVVSAGPRGQRPVGSDHYGQDSHRIAPAKAVARSR